MGKKMLPLLLLIIISLLAGCWDATDLEELSIPIAVGYDKGDKKQNIEITTLHPNSNPEAKNNARVEEVSGINVGASREDRAGKSSKEYIVGMLQVAIFGEELAAEGTRRFDNSLLRDPQIPNYVLMAVAEGRAGDILKTPTKNFNNIGLLIFNLLKQANKSGLIPTVTLFDYAKHGYSSGQNPVLPLIKQQEDDIIICGTALFKKDKMIGKIDLRDTRSLMLLRGIGSRGEIPYVLHKNGKIYENGSISAETSRKVKITRKDDQFTFTITVDITGSLIERFGPGMLLNHPGRVQLIEEQMKKDLTKNLEDFIDDMQDIYKVDCIDISKYALAKWRKELTPVIDDGFISNTDKVKINVEVKVKIKNYGELT